MTNTTLIVAAAAILASCNAIAGASGTPGSLNGDADLCYAETLKASSGADPATLSTAPCRRAPPTH